MRRGPRDQDSSRRLISTGSPFEARIGYSRAVVCDGWVFVSGTTGFDYATMSIPDLIPRFERILAEIENEAGTQ